MFTESLGVLARRRGAALVIALLVVACGGEPLTATSAPSLARRLEPDRDPAGEGVSVSGSLRRRIQSYRNIWVVAYVEHPRDLQDITKTRKRERMHYQPAIGSEFYVDDEHDVPAATRVVDCALPELPGEKLRGSVIQVREGSSGRRIARLVVDVDNSNRWILPGMEVALAVHTDKDPVLLMGVAELPPSP